MSSVEEQITLRIDQKLQGELDQIIVDMQEIAKNFNIKQIKERSPLKNVLAVATAPTSSLEVVKNYIRYQAGRTESVSKIWRLERNENNERQVFATAVVQQIDALSTNFQQMYDSIHQDLKQEINQLSGLIQENEKKDSVYSNLERVKKNLELLHEYLQQNREILKQKIHLQLTQLYLGYLSREHTALINGF